MSNIYTLLTAVILIVIFAIVIVVAVGLYVSSRRERAENATKAAAVAAAAPLVGVAAPAENAFFAGVENSNNIILEASKERPRRGTGYGVTQEADEFEL